MVRAYFSRRVRFLLAAVVAFSLPGISLAGSVSEMDLLRQQIAALEASNRELGELRTEVAQLRSTQEDQWVNSRRKEELKSMISEVLADADMRSSLMGSHMTAGHNGKKFFLASEDGSFLLKMKGQIQFRYIGSFQDAGSGASAIDDEAETGFVIRRAKLDFSGNVVDPRLGYAIQVAIDRSTNTAISDKIAISYGLSEGVTLWGGEDKAPFLREELTSSSRQQAVERSFVNEVFTMDKVQGVGLKIKKDDWMAHVMINDGYKSGDGGTRQNRFTQTGVSQVNADTGADLSRGSVSGDFNDDQTDFAITARADFRFAGNWKQMKDFAAWDGEGKAIFVGTAIHYEVGETGDDAFNNNFLSWTVEGSVEQGGTNLYAAIVGQHTDLEAAGASGQPSADDVDLLGVVVQAGFMMVPDKFEPFVRYEHVDFDNWFGGAFDEVDIVTVGFNYYMKKHAAKFTLDLLYAFDPLPFRDEGLGLQQDDADSDEQMVLRAQYQMLF